MAQTCVFSQEARFRNRFPAPDRRAFSRPLHDPSSLLHRLHENQELRSIRPLRIDSGTMASRSAAEPSENRLTAVGPPSEASMWSLRRMRGIGRARRQDVIFTGNGDFRVLVTAISRRGVHATIVSPLATTPRVVSNVLRREADAFLDFSRPEDEGWKDRVTENRTLTPFRTAEDLTRAGSASG
jgi:hypothetical protein